MGNRANLHLTDHNLTIYLHWNGGPESIAGFLTYAEEIDSRHDDYYPARLIQIIGNFMGGTLSIGVTADRRGAHCPGDNGRYHIRCTEGSEPLIIHYPPEGVRTIMTLTELLEHVKDDAYWSKPGETILDAIREKNASHFSS